MQFDIFGFEIDLEACQHGIWLAQVTTWPGGEPNPRSLLGIYHCDGIWTVDVLWFRKDYYFGE